MEGRPYTVMSIGGESIRNSERGKKMAVRPRTMASPHQHPVVPGGLNLITKSGTASGAVPLFKAINDVETGID
jgi:hypothetical protein